MTVWNHPDQRPRPAQVQRQTLYKVLTANGLHATPQPDVEPQIAPSFHSGTVVPDCTIPHYLKKLNLDNMVLLTKDMGQGRRLPPLD
jgi:hypothetical protein